MQRVELVRGILTPEQTEGPYYIDANLLRGDITEGIDGHPLQLDLTDPLERRCTLPPRARSTDYD